MFCVDIMATRYSGLSFCLLLLWPWTFLFSILFRGKMGASLHRSFKAKAIGVKPPYLIVCFSSNFLLYCRICADVECYALCTKHINALKFYLLLNKSFYLYTMQIKIDGIRCRAVIYVRSNDTFAFPILGCYYCFCIATALKLSS